MKYFLTTVFNSIIFLSVFLGFFVPAFAEPVFIKGSAPAAGGSKIEILTYTDFISNQEVTLAETRIDQQGFFEFKLDLKTITFSYLRIGVQRSEILLEPGQTYNLKVSGLLDPSLRDQEIAPFQIPPLQINILNPWRFELNGLVKDFLSFHDNFLAEHSVALVRQRDPKIVTLYIEELYNSFPGINHEWFNDMLTYKTASVEMMARAKGRETIAREYLLNREILYHHMIYMDFFNQFFEKYVITSRAIGRNNIITALESPDPYSSLMELLDNDALLADKRLRELVLIRNLPDMAGATGFRMDYMATILREIERSSPFSEHRFIAGNLAARLLSP